LIREKKLEVRRKALVKYKEKHKDPESKTTGIELEKKTLATEAPHFDGPVIASRDDFVLPESKAADGSLMTDKGGGTTSLFS